MQALPSALDSMIGVSTTAGGVRMSAQGDASSESQVARGTRQAFDAWGRQIDRLAYVCLALVVLECTLGSSGRWLVVGGLSGRNLLLLALLLLTLPRVWAQRRELLHSWLLRFTILAFASLAIGALIGLSNGNRPAFVAADVTTLVALLLVPGVLVTIDTRSRMEGLVKVFVGGATLLAAAAVAIYVLSTSSGEAAQAVNSFLNQHRFGGLSRLSPEVYRVYMRSGIFFPLALPYVIVAFSRGRHRFWSLVSMCLLMAGIVVSFTRGFMIAAVFVVVTTLVAYRWTGARLKPIALLLLSLIIAYAGSVLIFGQSAIADAWIGRAEAIPSVSIDDSTAAEMPINEQKSANVRELTLQREWQAFIERPVLGWGLGYNLDGLRDDGRTEYMYLDYLAKLGVVGTLALFAIFVVPPAIALLRLLRTPRARLDAGTQTAALAMVSLLTMAFVSSSNPFLNNTLGICVLLLCLAAAGQAGLGPWPAPAEPAIELEGRSTAQASRGHIGPLGRAGLGDRPGA